MAVVYGGPRPGAVRAGVDPALEVAVAMQPVEVLEPLELEDVRCVLCGQDTVATVLDAGARGRVVRCTECCLRYVSPRPRATAYLYRQESYFDANSEFGYPDYLQQRVSTAPYFRRLAQRVAGLCPDGSVLEVGSAAGFFLEAASDAGIAATGLEPSPAMASYVREALGLPIVTGMLGEAQLTASSYDVIVMLQTFEHLPSPATSLREIRALLKPGGTLLITTPNVGSWLSRLTGARWFEYKPPEHLYYFDPRSITALLRAEGFTQIEVRRDVHWHTLDFMLSRLERYHGSLGWLARATRAAIPRALLERSLPVYYGSMLVTAVPAATAR